MHEKQKLMDRLDQLIRCGEMLAEAATDLKAYFSIDWREEAFAAAADEPDAEERNRVEDALPVPDPDRDEAAVTPADGSAPIQPTKEDVRAILAKKSSEDGGRHRHTVKELVQLYSDGGTLKDVKPEDYAALIKEIGELK